MNRLLLGFQNVLLIAVTLLMGTSSIASTSFAQESQIQYQYPLYLGIYDPVGVSALQIAMTELGLYTGPSTGVYDIVTKDAVVAYQQLRGLSAHGVAGGQTIAALNEDLVNGLDTAPIIPDASADDTSSPDTQDPVTTEPETPTEQQPQETSETETNSPETTTTIGINPKTGEPYKEGTLYIGMTDNEKVSELQWRLHELGFYVGQFDGDFGPNTEQSVKDFQRAYDLEVDGVVGAGTFTVLVGAHQQKVSPNPNPNMNTNLCGGISLEDAYSIFATTYSGLDYIEVPVCANNEWNIRVWAGDECAQTAYISDNNTRLGERTCMDGMY